MGAFGGLIQTNKGRNLQAKAETGTQLKFTRMGIGDGQLSGQSIPSMNRLISEKKSLPITRLKTQLPAQAIVGAVLSNQDVTTGFHFREMGIFAEDPDEGEILYAYGNSGSGAAEYIPAGGTADIIEKTIDMIVTFGQAQNVSAVINSSLVYVTHEELAEALEGLDPDIPGASLTQPGIVQLSNATNGTRENVAPTEKALKAAYDRGSEGVTAAAAAQAKANAAETPAGAQAKANTAEANAKNYTDTRPWQKHRVSADDGAAIDISGQNLNNILLTGFYKGNGMINAPALSSGWGYVEVIRHTDTWVLQKVYDLHADRFYMRRRTDPGWTAWTQDLFQSVANGKQAIATAISGKGIAASGSDEFAVLANKISQIQTSSYQRTYYDWSSGTLPVQRGVMKYTTLADLGVVKGVLSVMSYTTGTHPDSTYSAMARTWVTTGAYTNDTVTAGFSLTNSLGQVQSLATLTDNEPYTYKRAELYLLSLHVDIPNRKYTIVTYNYQSERYNLSTNLFTPEFNLTVPLSLKTVSYTNSSAAKDAEGDGRIKGFVTIT
ncbi:tail fiber protein [Paenibacillus sp. JNUCC32]|uniref:tail fiber protein n=1 Tax=Paenibacillus sp. JNUCC32 TaxID=2777984 RepID=UPI001E354717|nr:tail fiber protein [Paenibacillus sp. JNUCC-32]